MLKQAHPKTEADHLLNAQAGTRALADKADKIPTNNSATAWSSGLASGGYHYLDAGSDALVVRTPRCDFCDFSGSVGGAIYDGGVMFYNDVVVWGDF